MSVHHGQICDAHHQQRRRYQGGQTGLCHGETVLKLLPTVPHVVRNVSKMLSFQLNSRDDDGVLVGNWTGDYTYGVAPTSWTGSTEILLNYAGSKMPVCYAQCWVYAAVFNTCETNLI